jgi:hypothetical protein
MKEYLKNNALTTKNKINNHFIKRLKNEELNEIKNLTSFCPNDTNIQIRVKFLIDGVEEFPKCIICSHPVRKHNKELRLLSTCSKECDYKLRVKLTKESNLNNYGVTSTNVLKKVKEKIKKTMIKNHGVESYTLSKDFIKKSDKSKNDKYGDPKFVNTEKSKQTKLERYGDKNYNNQEKYIDTCLEKYGVKSVMQNKEIFEKQQLNIYGSKKYKHLYYRGTYELLFITEFEKKFDINDLENGFAIKYSHNNKTKIYFPDFIIKSKNIIIEIKSSWTYDNNGRNIELRNVNKEKWKAAKSLSDYTFFPLKSKEEIKLYIKML